MGSFTAAGQYKVKVLQAYLAQSRFHPEDPNVVDVALYVQTLDGKSEGYWSGELSQNYGVGNAANMQQWELTLSSLEKIGWEHGQNITDATLATLVGQEIEVGVKEREGKDGGMYYDVRYLGAPNFAPKALNPADAQARIAAIFGANPRQPAARPAQASQTSAPVLDDTDPFA